MSGCDGVREMLIAVARGEKVSAPGDNSLRRHMQTCPDCSRRFENERMLSAGLAVMAISSLAVPPAHVKNALLAEFRRSNKVTPIRRPRLKWIAIAAAAAAIVAAVLVSVKPPARRIVTTVTAPPPAPVIKAAPAPTAPSDTAPTVTARVARPVKRRRPVKVQPPPAAEAAPPEVATDFFEIPYAEPLRPNERADVFRMQMPRANIAAFGLPVTGGRLETRVTADVLIGEDGVARAIRFIR